MVDADRVESTFVDVSMKPRSLAKTDKDGFDEIDIHR